MNSLYDASKKIITVKSTDVRSEEHTSELQSHSNIAYAVFCLKKNKIYELQWEEDNGEHKLENMLSSITVGYIDKENNDYKLIIELKDGEFVAGEPDKNEKWKYSYEKSTALNLDDINAGLLKKMVKEG